ncbi:NmrA/HSCARG family protein [Streptomyces cellulosae]|uniref:NmrA/HSCARG family protein n=1 Tax=Streptomyces cellulosae TaxID=1968 RepID=UPI0004CC0BFA|nr:NmrA/HSCARG family protein [Streptomyces cellulosae]
MPDENKPVLVLGATGKQGGSAARYLLERGWTVRAFVRDPGAPKAKELRELGASLHTGDLEDAESVRAAMKGAYGVFSIQTPMTPAGVEGEERQGKICADAARDLGIQHYVHSSVGGAERPEGVNWRLSKLAIEQRIQENELDFTFLRPSYFMENLNHDMSPLVMEDGVLTFRRGLGPTNTLQMISGPDIGYFAADAFDDPATFGGAKIELAGDELTGEQIADAFGRHTGLPARFVSVPIPELHRTGFEWQAISYTWLNGIGYHADIPTLRARFPQLLTLDQWLAKTGWAPVRPA